MVTGTTIKKGYKKTELGVIPEEWNTLKLKQITLDMLQGVNTAIDKPEYVHDGIPMLKANNIIDREVIFEGADHISLNTFLGYNDRYKAKKNDFLFSNIGARLGTGSLLKKEIECSFAWNVMRIVPDTHKVTPEYLSFLINSPKYSQDIKSKQSGSGMGFVPKGVMRELVFALPKHLEEQTVIATIHSDTCALIEHLGKLIAKKKVIKQGTMQQLFTGKKRLPGFGGEWKMEKLGDIAEFYKGKGLPKNEIITNGKYKCIHYGELFTTYHEEIKKIFSYTNEKDNYFLSHINDVLMPTSDVTPNGLATASCIKENNVVLGGDILIIRAFKSALDGCFLSYGISQNKKQIMQLVSGSTVYHLYGSDMKKYKIKVPPTIKEQVAIATVLSDIDSEIENLEQKRDKYIMIKEGIIQQLLTGKIRIYGSN